MKKYNLFGIFLLGFLLISTSFGLVTATAGDDEDLKFHINTATKYLTFLEQFRVVIKKKAV